MPTIRTEFSLQPQDWREDSGRYMNTCCGCRAVFLGNKRRVTCRTCATAEASKTQEPNLRPEIDLASMAVDQGAEFARDGFVKFSYGAWINFCIRARAALASAPVADESPMAKMADALREKARQERQAYQDRRNQATEWGPLPEGTEADHPISNAPVAHVAGNETSRYLEWAKDRSAWEMPVGTPVYYSAMASTPVTDSAPEAEEEQATDAWRRLALQFDAHRMQFRGHLQAMLADPEKHRAAAQSFYDGPPPNGEAILAQRIAAAANDQIARLHRTSWQDSKILDYLAQHTVEVRTTLRYGSEHLFVTAPVQDEDVVEPSDLRAQCLRHMPALEAEYGKPRVTWTAPENEIHKAIVRFGVPPKQQGYVMGLLREHNLVHNPRDGKPKEPQE